MPAVFRLIQKGDAKKLSELMRRDPDFDVNQVLDKNGFTLLHHACWGKTNSAVIPLLLAHPDIDVNLKETVGLALFYLACAYGYTSCVREMLKDSRVNPNEPTNEGSTPL